nr:uncharacterized protein LOC121502380 [Drosophila kikkawai]
MPIIISDSIRRLLIHRSAAHLQRAQLEVAALLHHLPEIEYRKGAVSPGSLEIFWKLFKAFPMFLFFNLYLAIPFHASRSHLYLNVKCAWQVFWDRNNDRYASSQPVNKYSSLGTRHRREKATLLVPRRNHYLGRCAVKLFDEFHNGHFRSAPLYIFGDSDAIYFTSVTRFHMQKSG